MLNTLRNFGFGKKRPSIFFNNARIFDLGRAKKFSQVNHCKKQYCLDFIVKRFRLYSNNVHHQAKLANTKEIVDERSEIDFVDFEDNHVLKVTKENFGAIKDELRKEGSIIRTLEFNFVLSEKEINELCEVIKDNTELGYVGWHVDQMRYGYKGIASIENKLVENNKNYKSHPNDYVYGLLSKHAYRTSKEGDLVNLDHIDPNFSKYLKNWRVERVFNNTNESGYYGAICVNDKARQVVLANRGTEGIIKGLFSQNSDWKTNIEEILHGKIVVGQQAWNFKATEEAINIAKNTGYRLSFTGHSLGGWLAELSAFYSHAYFNYRNIKVVTFDSPGTVPMMEKLQSNIRDKDSRIKLEDLEITTYLAKPNPVNCCNSHVGKVYMVKAMMEPTEKVVSKTSEFTNHIIGDKLKGVSTIEGHRLLKILETFDPETGKPKLCEKMLDWPRVEYCGHERTSSQVNAMIKDIIKNSGIPVKGQRVWQATTDYIVGDTTIATLIDFLKSYVKGEIKQDQYWEYFSHIEFEQKGEKNDERKINFSPDNKFILIALAKFRRGEDIHVMELTPGSVDKFLHKLYIRRKKLEENKDLSPQLKTQLKDLLASYRIEKNGQSDILVANKGHHIEDIRQRTQRLLQVIPEDIQKVWQNVVSTQNQRRMKLLPDNLPLQTVPYIEIHGKEKELENKLSKDQVILISGAGGMGKSTLATKFGRDKKQEGWQVRWIKGTQIDEEFSQLAKDLNISIAKLRPEEIRNLVYRGLEQLSKKQRLLIFDNIDVNGKEKIKHYLVNLPIRTKIIITSRNGSLLEGVKPINVEGFERRQAISYLQEALGKNEKEAEQLVDIVSESPFRLSKTVAYLSDRKLTNIDVYIAGYNAIKKGYAENDAIYPEVELLFGDLKTKSPESWQLLKYFAYLDPEGASKELVILLVKKSSMELQQYVNELEHLSLMNVISKGNQIILKVSHHIVQDETKKALAQKDKNKTEQTKILEELIIELNKKLPYINEDAKTSLEMQKIVELVNHAKIVVEEGKELSLESIEDLLEKIGAYYFSIFNYNQAINYCKKALNRQIHKKNHSAVANILDFLGVAYPKLGGEKNVREGLECGEKALKIRQKLFPNDLSSIANSLNNIGLAYQALGSEKNIQEGLKYLEEALRMYKGLFPGNHPNVANLLNDVGEGYRKLRGEENIRKGVPYLEKALKMSRALFPGNHRILAAVLHNIGLAYEELIGEENIRKGLQYLEEALQMSRALFPGDHPYVANILNSIGLGYQKLGGEKNMRKCLEYQKKALKMYHMLFPGNHATVASLLNNVGKCYHDLGGEDNIRNGLKYLEKALEMYQVLFPCNHSDVARILSNIGKCYPDLGGEDNIRKGLKYLKEALKMYQELFPDNHQYIVTTVNKIGECYQKLGKEE